jgi:hypothetical protein
VTTDDHGEGVSDGAGGLSRRTVISAAAWTTPVVVMAVSTPAAAASLQGFDLTFDPYNAGDGIRLFNEDFSRRVIAAVPLGAVVSNHGTLAAPAGATVTASCDARVFTFTGMKGQLPGEASSELTILSNTTEGNRSIITAVIPSSIPAGTDSYTGYRVNPQYEIVAAYPNDAVAPVLDVTWVIGAPAGDLQTSNNTTSNPGYLDDGPASAWGVLAEATWEKVAFGDGAFYLHRATNVTLTSVGPTPALAGGQIQILTDQRISTSITVDQILLNGAPAGDAIVFDRDDSYFGQVIYKYFTTTVDLVAGDVVEFAISYTTEQPATLPENLSGSQINFIGVVPNDEDRRAMNISSATNTDRTGSEQTP